MYISSFCNINKLICDITSHFSLILLHKLLSYLHFLQNLFHIHIYEKYHFKKQQHLLYSFIFQKLRFIQIIINDYDVYNLSFFLCLYFKISLLHPFLIKIMRHKIMLLLHIIYLKICTFDVRYTACYCVQSGFIT